MLSVALVSLASPGASHAGARVRFRDRGLDARRPGGGRPAHGLPQRPDQVARAARSWVADHGLPLVTALVARGMTLYENGCSACHGTLLEGQPGVAPSLVGVGAGPVDFYLSTGRMPLSNPTQEPERASPAYTRSQIDALIAWITKVGGGPPAPAADPTRGDLATGLHQFTLHCAGCHQMVGRGGLTLGASVPNLQTPRRCRSPKRCAWGRI